MVQSGQGLLAVRPPGPIGPLDRREHYAMFHSTTISILEQEVTEDNFIVNLLSTWISNLWPTRVSIRAVFLTELLYAGHESYAWPIVNLGLSRGDRSHVDASNYFF